MSDEEEVSILAHKKSKKPQFIDSDDDDSEEEAPKASPPAPAAPVVSSAPAPTPTPTPASKAPPAKGGKGGKKGAVVDEDDDWEALLEAEAAAKAERGGGGEEEKEGGGGGSKKSKKKDKKKAAAADGGEGNAGGEGGEAPPPVAPSPAKEPKAAAPAPAAAPAKPLSKVAQLALERQRLAAEEESRRKAEEAAAQAAYEAEVAQVEAEEKRKADAKAKRIEDRRVKKETAIREGTYLTKKQREEATKLVARLDSMKAAGMSVEGFEAKRAAAMAQLAAGEAQDREEEGGGGGGEGDAASSNTSPTSTTAAVAAAAAAAAAASAAPKAKAKGVVYDSRKKKPTPHSSSATTTTATAPSASTAAGAPKEEKGEAPTEDWMAAAGVGSSEGGEDAPVDDWAAAAEDYAAEAAAAAAAAASSSSSKSPMDTASGKKGGAATSSSASTVTLSSGGPSTTTTTSSSTGRSLSMPERIALSRERRRVRLAEAQGRRSRDNLRSPICVVLGHVDTGKTSLLDKIRRTNVQEGEAGGITQQIGATYFPMEALKPATDKVNELNLEYKVPGLLVVDTPGHEQFTNLRSRGSSLCDIAVLVVDIMVGLERQTLESLELLRQRKTPFIVALNKVDRMYGWKALPNSPIRESLATQPDYSVEEFERRTAGVLGQLQSQGFNARLYYENDDFRRNVSVVPTSAFTGEGVPDLLMLLVQLTQVLMSHRIQLCDVPQATVLEVKGIDGLGTTVDIVLVNGEIKEGDTIVACGMGGPIVTQVRALLTPPPMKEMRVKSDYVHHKVIKAAQGIKVVAADLELAVAGTELLILHPEDEIEDLKQEVMADFEKIMQGFKREAQGVYVQASTLGSLEALLEYLRTHNPPVPVANVGLGPLHRKDVVVASVMLERRKEYATILAFDVKITAEAEGEAESLGVKIFRADIIYHLTDQFSKYLADVTAKKQASVAADAVFPAIVKIIPTSVFNKKDPIVVGVDVVEGKLKVGTPLCVVLAADKVVTAGGLGEEAGGGGGRGGGGLPPPSKRGAPTSWSLAGWLAWRSTTWRCRRLCRGGPAWPARLSRVTPRRPSCMGATLTTPTYSTPTSPGTPLTSSRHTLRMHSPSPSGRHSSSSRKLWGCCEEVGEGGGGAGGGVGRVGGGEGCWGSFSLPLTTFLPP